MTKPTIIYARALECFKSPHNVRTQSDASADAELETNIGATGFLLENLIGVQAPRGSKKSKFEIYGGGRRLEAVHRNIEKAVFDEDFMVPVLVAKNAKDAVSMSLEENYFQLPMNPADECCGFQAIIEREKKTPAEVAKRIGKTEKFVLGRLRLANLAEPVFTALRQSEIAIEVAKAYGSTADQDRQAKVYEQMQGSYQRYNVNEIRRLLASGSYKGGDPKALLVGRDAYVAAGGRIDSDLFSDAENETWLDAEIVESLAEQALAAAAAAIRERDGFAEVRVVPATHIPYRTTYQLREIEPEPMELTGDAASRHAEIEAEIAEIEAEIAEIEKEADGQEDYTEQQCERIETLNAELESLSPGASELTPAQKAGAIAYLLIDGDGTPKLHEEFFAAEPEAESDMDDLDDEDGGEDDADLVEAQDDADGDAVPGMAFSMRLRDELAMMKTELLAVHIANDPQFALDLGTFIMADDACRPGWSGMPSELRAKAPSPRVSGFESDTPAARAWAKLEEELDRSWLGHESIEARYDAFCGLDDAARAAWLGWAIARTITAVPDGATGSGFLGHLGGKLAIDVASWWRPTARNFFDRLTKPKILGLFESIGGLELKTRYAASRKFDLAASAERLFAGEVIADAEVKARAIAWVPDEMRFASILQLSTEDADVGDHIADGEGVEASVEAHDVDVGDLPQAA